MSFRFFSGFGFSGEEDLFSSILPTNREFLVVGFSMGAIDAFNYTKNTKERIENLYLISPAFYQDRDEKFKSFQLNSFIKNSKAYQERVYNACETKSNIEQYKIEATKEELKKLLWFDWNKKELLDLIDNGTKITVFLGEKDRVIDSQKALEFFEKITTVYFYKNRNHLMEEL